MRQKCVKLPAVKNEPPPAIDQRTVRALAHPSRIAILETLVDEEGLGLSQLSEKLEVKAANVSYHVSVLTESGMIEAVLAPGNGVEQLFRLTPRSPIGRQRWGEISESMRGEISTALLQTLIADARGFPRNYDGRDA
jgi:DNA-binding transcriptional ArsR family regulator